MWVSYIFRADIIRQKEMVKRLKPIIEALEREGLIDGFNFNHYYFTPPKPEDHLALRLSYPDLERKSLVEEKLRLEGFKWEEQSYREKEEIKKAYELGSRFVFLFLNSINGGKIEEKLLKNKEFLLHMLHGICNSLSIPSVPDELYLHYNLYLNLAKQHFLSKKLDLNLKPYVDKVNEGPPERFFERLVKLAENYARKNLIKNFQE